MFLLLLPRSGSLEYVCRVVVFFCLSRHLETGSVARESFIFTQPALEMIYSYRQIQINPGARFLSHPYYRDDAFLASMYRLYFLLTDGSLDWMKLKDLVDKWGTDSENRSFIECSQWQWILQYAMNGKNLNECKYTSVCVNTLCSHTDPLYALSFNMTYSDSKTKTYNVNKSCSVYLRREFNNQDLLFRLVVWAFHYCYDLAQWAHCTVTQILPVLCGFGLLCQRHPSPSAKGAPVTHPQFNATLCWDCNQRKEGLHWRIPVPAQPPGPLSHGHGTSVLTLAFVQSSSSSTVIE